MVRIAVRLHSPVAALRRRREHLREHRGPGRVLVHDDRADAGDSLRVAVTAANSGGTGVASSAQTNALAAVPSAPTGVSATAGNAQATVSFDAASANGSPVTGYTVTSSPGGKTASGAASPIVVTGLTNGTSYTFTVKATGGARIAAVAAVTAGGPAGPAARGHGAARDRLEGAEEIPRRARGLDRRPARRGARPGGALPHPRARPARVGGARRPEAPRGVDAGRPGRGSAPRRRARGVRPRPRRSDRTLVPARGAAPARGRRAREAARLGLSYSRIAVRDQRTRWGSCSTRGTLSFSWRLALAPPEVLEYVVVHELLHLREHNHSRAFWQLLDVHRPGWRAEAGWLRMHGEELQAYTPSSSFRR